ncbi:MAG: type II secretion system F family protein [Candidatus Aenigmarchaeota archaeon]|nr:type II secretion system F family protein [Candidatus Aenigmarchaeota archaeon]
MNRSLIILTAASISISILLVIMSYFVFREYTQIFSTILIVAVVVAAAPIIIFKYAESVKIKSLEDQFPQFMNDIVEAVRSGMSLPQAINLVSKNDYGNLTYYVRKLNAQLEWGIPFTKAFSRFAKSTKSKVIARIAATIIESHEYGGDLTDVFETISNTTVEIERLREERKLFLNSQIVSGYIIFFVFLAVMIGLQKYLVPTLTEISVRQLVAAEKIENKKLEMEYKSIFRNLIIIQGLFAGLTIGKMSEGELINGVKHSLFMMVFGIIIFGLLT